MSRATTLQGRLLSPAGFGLVLLTFFLPFIAVSCGTGDNEMTATFSGLAMATGTRPDITGVGLTPDDVATIHTLVSDQYDLEPFAFIAALVILAGMGSALLRRVRTRLLVAAGLGAAAAALLVAAELRAIDRLESVRGSEIVGLNALPDPGVAGTRYGFWVALVGLLALVVAHLFALVRAPASAPPPPRRPADEPTDEGLFFHDDSG